MDENTINDINKKFENLTKKCELLEKINKVNENAILNLNTQMKFLREEHKKELENIKLNFTIQLKNFFNTISQNKEKGKEFAEIIIVDQKNGMEDIKNMCIRMINKIENEFAFLKLDVLQHLGNTPGNSEKINEIIDDKEVGVVERFENKLFNIYYKVFLDINKTIPHKDLMELKKLGSALLIKEKISPLIATKSFLDKNILNKNEINGIVKMSIDMKKGYIFNEMDDILLRKLDNIFEDKYIKEFKEKYGILDEEISDNIIKQEIINQDYNETHILEAILKKLNYIK